MTPADLSVVIPAINEQATIELSIRSAIHAGAGEVIVVDGGSDDRTIDAATRAGASQIVRSPAGRGIQLNSGASLAQGQVLVFLHADNELGPHCLQQICNHSELVWGAFRQRIDSPRSIYRMIEWGNWLRAKYRGIPFGDQAIFVRRSVFNQQGGFAEIPLMEDVEFSTRMRRIAPPLLLDGQVKVSDRRWRQHGPVRQTLRNWMIQLSYRLGANPETLRQRYR